MATWRPLSRKTLWLGLAGVLLPLAVLLVLQYRWLKDLDRNSSLAQQAVLDNLLAAVSTEVEYHYRTLGDKTLQLRPRDLTREDLTLNKKKLLGVRHFFVVSFLGDEPRLWFYDGLGRRRVELPDHSPERQAAYFSIVPLKVANHQRMDFEDEMRVEVRGGQRIVLNPVLDESNRVVGGAGLIVDEEYFRTRLLDRIVREKRKELVVSSDSRDKPSIAVLDRDRREVYSLGERRKKTFDAERPLSSFVWADWKIGLESCMATPKEWAASNFYINLWISALLSGALVLGVLLALRAASREIRLSQMKGDFVSNVSHELRTPLASIRVFGELLRMGRVDSPDKAREYGEYIETESRRLSQLINNILDFGSIESGRKQYRFEPTDLADLVGKTLRTFEVRLRQAGFSLRFEPPREPLPEMRLDAGAIAQSLSNLLDNAVKYSGDGREITVGLEREGGAVALWVRDRGIGIPKDEQKKIFDRFHRVGTGLVHNVKGSGLGLAIVEHIASAHGGRVTVDSRPGEGSTFTLRLPLPEAPAAATEPRTVLGSPGLQDRPA